MRYRKEGVSMGLPSLSEYELWLTDEAEFRACAETVHALGTPGAQGMRSRDAEFERKLAQTGLRQLPDLLQALPDETARLARLCYAASPVSDWLDTPPEVFFSCAAHARYLRENASWTRALPAPLFLAYVLHPRVNNEALCDCRPVFYAALAERLRGLPEEAAVLEINRWCAEHVVYQPTDERTRSALAVLRAGFGRCGEESMFAVNVLRACGFAARQVYVPRWAHCDDNHAWVEVWCGGAWHFLGACEPEAVLDRGWFNSAAGRAVLVHSRCFGEPEPGAESHRPRGRCGLLQRNGPLC